MAKLIVELILEESICECSEGTLAWNPTRVIGNNWAVEISCSNCKAQMTFARDDMMTGVEIRKFSKPKTDALGPVTPIIHSKEITESDRQFMGSVRIKFEDEKKD